MKIPDKRYIIRAFIILVLSATILKSWAQEDHTHYSKTFGREKPYRIFFPKDYAASQERYPVIYYFHGNKGSHEMELTETALSLVEGNKVIMVAWNGRSAGSDVRPYNIGFHSNVNYETQFKDYFPELTAHIDSAYRTLTDRQHRAVIGHSMGGIMSFFLAGKYPHLIGAAINVKGSPEFFIGYPDNHTLYSVRYFFKNLSGVKLRFHNSTAGELVYLNNEVHQGALREKELEYEYRVYEGGHGLSPEEFTDAFHFVVNTLKQPMAKPGRWHHADLYPDFDVWGYEVHSDLKEPGFIEMHGVTKGGLGITTKKWQPEGRTIPGVKIQVKTAPEYRPNSSYTLLDYNLATNRNQQTNVKSDNEGRIAFSVNHEPHQFGIFQKNDPAEIVVLNYRVNGKSRFLDHKKPCALKLHLLNRGGSAGKGLKVNLSSATEGIRIANPSVSSGDISSCADQWLETDFQVTASNQPPNDGSPFQVRFCITVTDHGQNTWKDEFDAPVFFDVPEFIHIGIDDGDSEMFGNGNGNNIAEPGESIMIYELSHRTRLWHDDPYIDSERIHVDLQPDKWGDGYAVSSVVDISENCPAGHQIKFLASYEVKEWKAIKRHVTWGTFIITIGKEHWTDIGGYMATPFK